MPDDLAVVQAHLEAIRALVAGPVDGTIRQAIRMDVADALLALVVERERATTRDEQIRQHITAAIDQCEGETYGVTDYQMQHLEAILALLGAGDGARPDEWCPCCHVYHARPVGEKQDNGKLIRECPLNPYPVGDGA